MSFPKSVSRFQGLSLVPPFTEPGSTWVREIIDERDLEGDRPLHIILLKAYDAVQLAIALRYRQALTDHQLLFTFVSGDATLICASG